MGAMSSWAGFMTTPFLAVDDFLGYLIVKAPLNDTCLFTIPWAPSEVDLGEGVLLELHSFCSPSLAGTGLRPSKCFWDRTEF